MGVTGDPRCLSRLKQATVESIKITGKPGSGPALRVCCSGSWRCSLAPAKPGKICPSGRPHRPCQAAPLAHPLPTRIDAERGNGTGTVERPDPELSWTSSTTQTWRGRTSKRSAEQKVGGWSPSGRASNPRVTCVYRLTDHVVGDVGFGAHRCQR